MAAPQRKTPRIGPRGNHKQIQDISNALLIRYLVYSLTATVKCNAPKILLSSAIEKGKQNEKTKYIIVNPPNIDNARLLRQPAQ